MGTRPDDALAMCPYYLGAPVRKQMSHIACEGVLTGSTSTQKFISVELRDKFFYENCVFYPNDCPLARLLDEKYLEETDENE